MKSLPRLNESASGLMVLEIVKRHKQPTLVILQTKNYGD